MFASHYTVFVAVFYPFISLVAVDMATIKYDVKKQNCIMTASAFRYWCDLFGNFVFSYGN